MAEICLDVGCGESVRPGYIGVDVRAIKGVTVVCDAWKLEEHFAGNSVDRIYCRHSFEHLTFAQGRATLSAFLSVLKAGSELELVVPDIRFHISQFLDADPNARSTTNPKWGAREHAIAGFWGWQRESDLELWDVHKSGYDEWLLGETLLRTGFVDLHRLPDKPWNLSVAARKPYLGARSS